MDDRGAPGFSRVGGGVDDIGDCLQHEFGLIVDNAVAGKGGNDMSGVEIGGWYALLAPAGTPKAIVHRIYAETVNAFKSSAELRERFESTGSEIVLNAPADFAERIKREIVDFTKVARAANITVNR